jgi:hypothetical protein
VPVFDKVDDACAVAPSDVMVSATIDVDVVEILRGTVRRA